MEVINLRGEKSFQIHDSHFFKVILFPSDQGLVSFLRAVVFLLKKVILHCMQYLCSNS